MSFTYRTTPLPPVWPGTPTARRQASPFKANWGDTLVLLHREVKAIGVDPALAIGVKQHNIRNDGGVKADARIQDPSVIFSITRGADRLSFPCDRFNFWQDNVRAIALALEALRKVDRYGVQSGKQYQGFKSLPGAGGLAEMGAAEAADILCELSDGAESAGDILESSDKAKAAYRRAAAVTHPDRTGGDDSLFKKVQAARGALTSHHGVSF